MLGLLKRKKTFEPPVAVKTRRILMVDDEEGFTRLSKMSLERAGHFEVRVENDPRCALGAAREFLPDLILLDVMMPYCEGGELAARMETDPVLRETPIIFITAAIKKEEVDSFHGRIGGRLYLAKPVTTKDLLDAIDRVLGNG